MTKKWEKHLMFQHTPYKLAISMYSGELVCFRMPLNIKNLNPHAHHV